MKNKLEIEYSLSFKKIIEIEILHDYFNNDTFKYYEIKATPKTDEICNNYNLKLRKTERGFVILSENNEKYYNSSFKGDVKLDFFLILTDPFFISYTKIPYSNKLKFNFKNSFGKNLHLGNHVDINSVSETNNNKYIANINLVINKKNEFFGSDKRKNQECLSYSIKFKSREVFFRYNFISDKNSLKNYYITDEDNSINISKFTKTKKAANNKDVYSLTLNVPFQLKEYSDKRFFLKKDDEFFKSFSFPLPNPDKKNVVFDRIENKFYGDIYVDI